MAGIGALLTARGHQSLTLQHIQQQIQRFLLHTMSDQPGTELTQDRGVEPSVIKLHTQRVLPVHPEPHPVRRAPISQIFSHLQHRDQRQPPR
jgi:hypothetical protein